MSPSSDVNTRAPLVNRLLEIVEAFSRLGCISFGGPVAHLGYLREEFVSRRKWLDDEVYGDLVALCQFLPGPASSQVVFALGMRRAGVTGAMLASLCFTLPSAIFMILFAYSVATVGDIQKVGWLHGLKLAAVVVVAQAVWGMGQKLCFDRTRLTIALIVAAFSLITSGPAGQIGAIATGAFVGYWLFRSERITNCQREKTTWNRHHVWASGALIFFLGLLFLLPSLAALSGNFLIKQFDSFYRAGSLVFGGGHVVLPLLRAEVVSPHWINDSEFLAGYGAVQALPGPLFTFAAYLGTTINQGPHAWIGGLWCLSAIFLPAWLLIGGSLPFWDLIRSKSWAQSALSGANAAVVGVLLAALYNPVWKQGVTNANDVAVVLVLFTLLAVWKIPPWLVVGLSAAAGQVLYL